MNHLKSINEFFNVSKKEFLENYYDIYNMSKDELGKWLNVWYPKSKDTHYKNKKITYDVNEMWTVKKVDKETRDRLYMKVYNPISLNIIVQAPKPTKDEIKYTMKAQIHSIDDSSFGIWFDGFDLQTLEKKRNELMKWVSSIEEINGEEFLEKCVELGADESTKDYN